ncbi:unnamed protein product [Caenorhabditis brenneri]
MESNPPQIVTDDFLRTCLKYEYLKTLKTGNSRRSRININQMFISEWIRGDVMVPEVQNLQEVPMDVDEAPQPHRDTPTVHNPGLPGLFEELNIADTPEFEQEISRPLEEKRGSDSSTNTKSEPDPPAETLDSDDSGNTQSDYPEGPPHIRQDPDFTMIRSISWSTMQKWFLMIHNREDVDQMPVKRSERSLTRLKDIAYSYIWSGYEILTTDKSQTKNQFEVIWPLDCLRIIHSVKGIGFSWSSSEYPCHSSIQFWKTGDKTWIWQNDNVRLVDEPHWQLAAIEFISAVKFLRRKKYIIGLKWLHLQLESPHKSHRMRYRPEIEFMALIKNFMHSRKRYRFRAQDVWIDLALSHEQASQIFHIQYLKSKYLKRIVYLVCDSPFFRSINRNVAVDQSLDTYFDSQARTEQWKKAEELYIENCRTGNSLTNLVGAGKVYNFRTLNFCLVNTDLVHSLIEHTIHSRDGTLWTLIVRDMQFIFKHWMEFFEREERRWKFIEITNEYFQVSTEIPPKDEKEEERPYTFFVTVHPTEMFFQFKPHVYVPIKGKYPLEEDD